MNDTPDVVVENDICNTLTGLIHVFDLVIVADYGHGMITEDVQNLLYGANYLAVSTQINAENYGFNTLDKYRTLNYGCINEDELRLVNKSRFNDIVHEITNFKFPVNTLMVTRGHNGCIILRNSKVTTVPALTTIPVDSMGAGDAVFALTSPLAYLKAPVEIIGFVGSAAGALACSWVGNKKYVTKIELTKYMETLLK